MGLAAGESLTNGQKAVQGGGTVKAGFSGAPAIRIGFSKYIIHLNQRMQAGHAF